MSSVYFIIWHIYLSNDTAGSSEYTSWNCRLTGEIELAKMGKYAYVTLSGVQSWHFLGRTEENDEKASRYSTAEHPGYNQRALYQLQGNVNSAYVPYFISKHDDSPVYTTVICWLQSVVTFPSGIV